MKALTYQDKQEFYEKVCLMKPELVSCAESAFAYAEKVSNARELEGPAATEAAKATSVAVGEPVAYLRFRAAQQWSGIGGHDIEHNEWLETCHAHEVGDDGTPAFPVFDGPVLAHTDSDIFDLIREWAALPEGERHNAAHAIIGSVNRSYSAGVADGKALGEAARQPAPALPVKRYELTPEYNRIACQEVITEVESAEGEWVKFKDHQAALAATAAPVLSDEQISKMARYLSDFSSAQCGVDKDDAWAIYGNDEIELVRAAFAATRSQP